MPSVVPEYPLHRKSLILPPEGNTLDGMIGQHRLAFAIESPKPCEELTGMGRRPSVWMTELVEGVAGCMEVHSPILVFENDRSLIRKLPFVVVGHCRYATAMRGHALLTVPGPSGNSP